MHVAGALVLVSLSACTCTSTTDSSGSESHIQLTEPIKRGIYVDLPTTVPAVLARSRPPDVIGEVHWVTIKWEASKVSKSGTCHAGVVCVLALLLPSSTGSGSETHQQASITDHGKVIYEATFSASNDFETARLVDGTKVRYVEVVHASSINRELIVVTREATLDGDHESEWKQPSLLSQVDVGPDYLAALLRNQQHGKHKPGGLGESFARHEAKAQITLNEMRRVLSPEDGAGLARTFLTNPQINEPVKELIRTKFPAP
jgi:hypothetical protein